MTTTEIAKDFVAICASGAFRDAGEKYWADDVVSVEGMGPPGADAASHGKDAARGKSDWWMGSHDIHATEAHGPYINGDQFAVRFVMDVTFKETGARHHMEEMALYTLRDGKIAEERFFFLG